VAQLDKTTRDLALKLAHDEAEVAAPILTHSNALTEDDLAHLAQHKSQDHLVAIARRQTLTSTVTDVLVDRGNSNVLTTVTLNPGAEISHKGFTVLADKARENRDLGEALSYRADMPPAIAEQIISTLDDTARERLQRLLSGDAEMISKLMNTARREIDAQRSDSRRSRLETTVMVQDVREGKASASQVLDTLVFKKRMLDIAFVLSELAQVPEAHVSNVLHKVNAMGIAVVCRTLDITEPVYDRLSRLRCERLRLNAAQAEAMNRDYKDLDKASAERTLRFHKVRSSVRAS
jgi:uncharacterized protein (DUF2336 family)